MKRLLTAHSASPSTSEPAGFYSTLANPGSTLNTHSYAYLLHESDQWLIDSGASKHMTEKSTVFSSYSPQSGRDKVRIADGSLSPIIEKGVIIDLYGLHLYDVLHVPNFPHILLSISAITNSLKCTVTFSPTDCVFQELKTGKVIERGSHRDGLYFLEDFRMHKQLETKL